MKEANPLHIYIRRNLKGIHYTVSEAAEEIGKSAETLRRWRRTGFMVPSVEHKMGELTVYLYTEEDLIELKKLVPKTRRGKRLDTISG